MVVTIFIGLGLGLLGIGVLGMLISGIRSITLGKSDFKKLGVMVVPFVIFGAAYGSTGSVEQAGVATMIILMGLMFLSILFTGLKGTFKL